MITSFCECLGWAHLRKLLKTFQSQIESGVARELVDLLRCQFISARRARCFFKAGLKTLSDIGAAKIEQIRAELEKMTKFMSKKKQTGENLDDVSDRVGNSGKGGEQKFEMMAHKCFRTIFSSAESDAQIRFHNFYKRL